MGLQYPGSWQGGVIRAGRVKVVPAICKAQGLSAKNIGIIEG